VDDLLATHQISDTTRIYYRNSWRNLTRFMAERRILLEDFTPATAHDYIAWRTSMPRTGGGLVGRNQALQDIKILKWIHRQGRLLGHLTTMAMVDFRCRKSPVTRKPVFTDEDIARCRTALSSRFVPDWMRTSFEIAYHTGCRLKETRLPLSCIDLDTGTMTFPEPKGGSGRAYTIPIPDGLQPLFQKLKATPRSHTFEWPGAGTRVSSYWRRFFNLLGLKKHSFHGLRATRVTALRRAGIVQAVAMRLVNHSSTLVHELYQRHSVEDLRRYVNAGLPPSKPQTPPETPAPAPWENPTPGCTDAPDGISGRRPRPVPANSAAD
jgi:integrase